MVEAQYAACVNLLPAVESIYRWQGNVEIAAEVLAIFKTTAAGYPAFVKALTALHPYDVPEIVALKTSEIAGPYRDWVISNVALPGQ